LAIVPKGSFFSILPVFAVVPRKAVVTRNRHKLLQAKGLQESGGHPTARTETANIAQRKRRGTLIVADRH
jgi:hypothetical protein